MKKCPHCKKSIKLARVISEAYQLATVNHLGQIHEYESPDVGSTIGIECHNCGMDISKVVHE